MQGKYFLTHEKHIFKIEKPQKQLYLLLLFRNSGNFIFKLPKCLSVILRSLIIFNCPYISEKFLGYNLGNILTPSGLNTKTLTIFITSHNKKHRGLVISRIYPYHMESQSCANHHSSQLQCGFALIQALFWGQQQVDQDWLLHIFLIHSPAMGREPP